MQDFQVIQKLLAATAAHYVSARPRSVAISTADGVRVLRAVVPGSTQSDHELADIVAQAAIAQRREVLFENASIKEARFWRAGLDP